MSYLPPVFRCARYKIRKKIIDLLPFHIAEGTKPALLMCRDGLLIVIAEKTADGQHKVASAGITYGDLDNAISPELHKYKFMQFSINKDEDKLLDELYHAIMGEKNPVQLLS
jgi:hypothetical protein